jgi:thiamine-monophosphate kinase
MKKLDESEIIKKFQNVFGDRDFVSEDVESFPIGKTRIIVKVDTLVQSTDIPPKMSLKDAARKSVVACVSDFASKGVKPKWGIISVNLPTNVSKIQVNEIAQGFRSASKEFGIKFLGGDTNQGKEIVFHVCLFGEAKKIVNRKGAKTGDIIFVTGPFGYTGIGLDILLKKANRNDIFSKKAIKSVTKPNPRLEFGLKGMKYFTSSMDSSDGLSTTLNEMSKQNNSKFVIEKIPSRTEIQNYSKVHKKKFESYVFNSGEEYEIVFTVPKKYKSKIISIANATKTPIIEIGKVVKGNGVALEKDQKIVKLKDFGYHHFKRNSRV